MNEKRTNVLATIITIVIAVAICALIFFAEWIAALLFIVLTMSLAIYVGRRQGFKQGLWQFLKNMIFGW